MKNSGMSNNICDLCGISFHGHRRHKKKFCSLECHKKYLLVHPRVISEDGKKRIGDFFRGKPIPEERKLKIKLNNAKYWLGKKRLKETNLKISKKLTGKYKKEDNPRWKGIDVCYKTLHVRVYDKRGMAKSCKVCGLNNPNKKYYWANLTGNYVDINDYKEMCASCHKKYDLRRAKLKLLSTQENKKS